VIEESVLLRRRFEAIWLRMSTAVHDAQLAGKPSSRLLEQAARLGLQLPTDLERLALLRGCSYYERDLDVRVPPLTEVPLSNAELAVALVIPSLSPGAREIRLAAALLGTPGLEANQVARLAREEDTVAVIRHIAQCGQSFEPENRFWVDLLANLPSGPVEADCFPHPTRFVEMTGIDRGKVGVSRRWIRPQKPVAA
jgi:hypothetical protein